MLAEVDGGEEGNCGRADDDLLLGDVGGHAAGDEGRSELGLDLLVCEVTITGAYRYQIKRT